MKEVVPDFEHEVLGKSSLNIGKISGGTLINVVPEYCEFRCDIRLVADHLREETKKKIENIIDEFNQNEEAKASIEIIHEIPAIELKEQNDFFDILKNKAKQLGVTEIIGVNYGTDGAMLVPDTNTPFIIMGPGKLDQLHVTDEYTEKEEVIQYTNLVYQAILQAQKCRVCLHQHLLYLAYKTSKPHPLIPLCSLSYFPWPYLCFRLSFQALFSMFLYFYLY